MCNDKYNNEPPVPEYIWVKGEPDPDYNYAIGGCYGCDFRRQMAIRCSRIPCQTKPGMVAKIVKNN